MTITFTKRIGRFLRRSKDVHPFNWPQLRIHV